MLLIDFVAGLVETLITSGGDVAGTAVDYVLRVVGQLVDQVASVADGLVSYLPDVPDLGLEVGGWIYGYSMLNTFLPLTEALAFTGLLVAAASAGLVWRGLVTLYHLIPKPLMGT